MGKLHRIDSHFRRYQKRGDPADLGRVFDVAAGEMLQIARGYARGDEALAEDAVQSSFLIAMEKAADFDGTRRVMPWLLGILANELRRERGRTERVPHPRWLQEGADARIPEDPRAVAADAELRALVQAKVRELPETYREAVAEHLFSSHEPSELAERLGISRGALHVRVHRGLGLLRGLLPAGAATAAGLVLTAPRGLAAVRGDLMLQVGAGAGSTAAGGTAAVSLAASKGAFLAASVAATLAGIGIGGAAVATWSAHQDSRSDMANTNELASAGAPPRRPATSDPSDAASPPQAQVQSAREPLGSAAVPIEESPAKMGSNASTSAAPTGDEALSKEAWLRLYSEARGYTEIYALGKRLIDLPGDSGFELAGFLYPQLSVATRKQFGKPFLFQEGATYGLDVADWIVNDEDESVRKFGWSFLRRYALVDFNGSFGDYAEWRAATEELDRAAALRTSARWLADNLRNATPEDALQRLSDALPPGDRTLEALDVRHSELFADTDLAQTLLPWLDPTNASLAEAAVTWLPFTQADESTYRSFVLPLLDTEPTSLRMAAARALVWAGASFAPEELRARFATGPGAEAAPVPDRADELIHELALWKSWFNEQ